MIGIYLFTGFVYGMAKVLYEFKSVMEDDNVPKGFLVSIIFTILMICWPAFILMDITRSFIYE